MRGAGFYTFDVETTGLQHYNGTTRIFSYCIGDENGNVKVYRLDRGIKDNLKILEDFFLNTTKIKIAHNFKFELSCLIDDGFCVPNDTVWHDTMLMSQLLRNLAPSHSLEYLSWELFKFPRELDKKVQTLGNLYGSYQKIPEHIMKPYQINDGIRPMVLFKTWYPSLLKKPKLYEDYLNEIELVKVTQRLEQYGINLHKENADKLLLEIDNNFLKLKKEIYFELGGYYNLGSAIQVSNLLFKKFEYPIMKLTKKNNISIDKNVIMDLRETYGDENRVFDMILKWRSFVNGRANIKSYIKHANNNGVIHPSINTNKARTGRQSANNPNIQNVSKEEALKNLYPIPARKCFCARKGHVLFFSDYSGIEMGLIIGEAQEKEMIDILNKGGDVHHVACECFYGLYKINDIKKSNPKKYTILRSAGKNAHFALSYGGNLKTIAATMLMKPEELEEGYITYCERFPSIAGLVKKLIVEVKENGYVKTPFGRKLYIPQDKAYIGLNYLIQGTAAGILKRAQVNIDKYYKCKYNDRIRIALPIHDELIISYPKKLLPLKNKILKHISKLMINISEINVPLKVEWKQTFTDWGSVKKIELL